MHKYLSPEGFDLDTHSGLFYRIADTTDEQGAVVRWITWFDADSGEYTQSRMPDEPAAEPVAVPAAVPEAEPAVEPVAEPAVEPELQHVSASNTEHWHASADEPPDEVISGFGGGYLPPDGFILHPESGLFFSASSGTDEQGKPLDQVTWFDPVSGEYAQVGYLYQNTVVSPSRSEQIMSDNLFNTIHSADPHVADAQALGMMPGGHRERSTKENPEMWNKTEPAGASATGKPLSRRNLVIALALLLVAAIGLSIWPLKLYERLPAFGDAARAGRVSAGEKPSDNADASGDAGKESDAAGPDSGTGTNGTAAQTAPETSAASSNPLASDCSLSVHLLGTRAAELRVTLPPVDESYPGYINGIEDGKRLNCWEVRFSSYSVAVSNWNEPDFDGKMRTLEEMAKDVWKHDGDSAQVVAGAELQCEVNGNILTWKFALPESETLDLENVDTYTLAVQGISGETDLSVAFKREDVLTQEPLAGGDAGSATEPSRMAQAEDGVQEGNRTAYPEVSLYRMLAVEDDEYVYTIHQRDAQWKFSEQTVRGSIYRFSKKDIGRPLEKIISPQGNEDAITSIALLGDYLYFGVDDLNDTSAYFRIPKAGGTAEYLFSQEPSFLQAYEGRIYLLFRESMAYASFLPNDPRKLETTKIDTTQLYDVSSGGARSQFTLFTPFAVRDGAIYLGGLFDGMGHYGRCDLKTGEVVPLQTLALDISENDEGAVSIYGANPVFLNQLVIANENSNGFISAVSKDLLVSYPNDGNWRAYRLDPSAAENKRFVRLDERLVEGDANAYGAVGSWVLLYNEGLRFENGRVSEHRDLSMVKDMTADWVLKPNH